MRGGLVDAGVAAAVARAAAELAADGLRGSVSAKRGSLQSYSQHALAVAAAAAKMAGLLAARGVDVAGPWSGVFAGSEWLLGFLGGLVHDHNKAWRRGERGSLRRLVEALLEAEGIVLGEDELDRLVEDLYAVAEAAEEGVNPATLGSGLGVLAAVVALADLLASSSSLAEASARLLSPEPRYRHAVKIAESVGLVFRSLYATRPSLVVAEASREIAGKAAERGCVALLVYHDGLLLLCPGDARVSYREAAAVIASRLGGGGVDEKQLERAAREYRRAAELAAGAASVKGEASAGGRGRELLDEWRRFLDCGRRGAKASDCGLEGAIAALAAAVALGLVEVGEAVKLVEEARRVYRNRLQKRNYMGNAKGLGDAARSHGEALAALVERLVGEGRVAEAAGVVAALVTGSKRPGEAEAELLASAAGLGRGEAERLLGLRVHAFPVVLGLLMRAAEREPDRLVSAVKSVVGKLVGSARGGLEEFAEYYACSSIAGTLLEGKSCSMLGEPEAYCSVCRAPLPRVDVGLHFAEYGSRLGLGRGVSELWTSDEPPLVSVEKSGLERATGFGRLVCPACIYEAERIARGLGRGGGGRSMPMVVVYMMHPVASPEQLHLAALAVERLVGAGSPEAVKRLAESLVEAVSGGSTGEAPVVVDYFSARVLVPPAMLEGLVDADKARSTLPTLQHAAALLYKAGPLLALLGGQVAVASSLALRQPRSLVSAGRPLLYVEEAVSAYGYRGGVTAALSFAARAEPLASRLGARDGPRVLERYLSQLEDLSSEPQVALTAPPRPGLLQRVRGEPRSPGLYAGLAEFIVRVLGGFGVEALPRLVEAMRLYAEALCCAARRGRGGGQAPSRHAVQGPLREALYHVLDYSGVLDPEDLLATAVGRAVEAARRRIGGLGVYEHALRSAVEAIAGELQAKLDRLAPGKARELVEAVLDTVYMIFSDCWYKPRSERDELCSRLRSQFSSSSNA